jgi:hypothetical protein
VAALLRDGLAVEWLDDEKAGMLKAKTEKDKWLVSTTYGNAFGDTLYEAVQKARGE